MQTNNGKGFTLLEALITILIAVISFVTIFHTLSIAMAANTHVEKSMIALNLCQEELESIKDASSYANVDTYAYARTNVGGDFADFDREVTVSSDPKEININVYWSTNGSEQTMSLASLIANYDY